MELIPLAALVLLFIFLLRGSRSKKAANTAAILPPAYHDIFEKQVAFYRALSEDRKKIFEERAALFLSSISIEGIRTSVEDIDRALIAASAVIPMFGFNNWRYSNLSTILLYPEHFSQEFELEGNNRNVMGMVGSGAMNHTMILSQPALREGFQNEKDKSNTAIHEFVHLLDKLDGDTDGIPEILLEKQYTIPWINWMHREINAILANRSDINPYGASSKTEFFAVAAEYFFERPELFKERHRDLYHLMEEIFDQSPAVKTAPVEKKTGRNDDCHCGSGEKFKHCHGKTNEAC